MRSGAQGIDLDEAMAWIFQELQRIGRPIPVEVVIEVVSLYVDFQLEVGNAVLVAGPSGEVGVVSPHDEGDVVSANLVCLGCLLASRITPPEGYGSGRIGD